MTSQRFRQVKHAQRESFFLREISNLFLRICIDDPLLAGAYVSRVKLSPDRGRCIIFLQDYKGKEALEAKMGRIIMYKPSLRSAIAKALQARYTPDLTFIYDATFEQQRHVDELITQLNTPKSEDEPDESESGDDEHENEYDEDEFDEDESENEDDK